MNTANLGSFTTSKFILLIVLCCLFPLQKVKAEMYIHQLQYIQPSEAINIIQPFLAKESKITAKQDKLFIQSTTKEFELIKTMLAEIDIRQDEFLIELKVLNRKLDGWEMQPTSASNSTRYSTNAKDKNFQIRLFAGAQGFIQSAVNSVSNQVTQQYGGFVPKAIERTATSGFFIRINRAIDPQTEAQPEAARLVNISLSTQTEQVMDSNMQNIRSTNTSSNFSSQLGHWILVAATDTSTASTNTSYTTQNNRSNKHWYYLRVSEIIN